MTATPVDKTYVMLMVADMTRAVRFLFRSFRGECEGSARPTGASSPWRGANIALHPGGSGSETRTGLGFEVKDLDAALQRATEVGGRITSPPRNRPEERIRVAEIADTEGNLITVAQLLALAGQRSDINLLIEVPGKIAEVGTISVLPAAALRTLQLDRPGADSSRPTKIHHARSPPSGGGAR